MKSIVSLAAILFASVPLCLCQQNQSLDSGFKPYGSFQGTDVDSVNLLNGNLTVHIPLASYPQRGEALRMDFSVRANMRGWIAIQRTNSVTNQPYQIWSWIPGSTGMEVVNDDFLQITPYVDTIDSYATFAYTVTSADGTSHLLGHSSATDPTQWRSLDASGYYLYANPNASPSPIYYGVSNRGIKSTFSGYAPHGIYATKQQDSNGNQITLDSSGWTDTMGRTFPVTYGGGTGGPALVPGTSTSDTSACPSGTSVTAYNLGFPGYNGGMMPMKSCYSTHTVSSNFGDPNIQESSTTAVLMDAIVLPNGTSWRFTYDTHGTISQLVYPTGGSVTYEATSSNDGIRITARTVSDGSSNAAWAYGTESMSGGYASVVTDPAGNDSRHVFSFIGAGSVWWSSAGEVGDLYETETDWYAGSGTGRTLMKKITATYSGIPNELGNFTADGGFTTTNAVDIVRLSTQTTWSANGKTTQNADTYDSGQQFYTWNYDTGATAAYPLILGSVVNATSSDYGPGSPGSTLRQTATTYQWQASSTYLNANLLILNSVVQVLDGSGNVCSETDYAYDGSTPQSSGISMQLTTSPGPRGNLSKTTSRLSSSPCTGVPTTSWTSITSTTSAYDTGMPYQTVDALGHKTTYSYSGTYYGAYLTGTNLPPTTNPQKAPVSHAISGTYDFNTGVLTSFTDQSGNGSSYVYDSSLRISAAIFPDTDGSSNHGETDFYYKDASNLVERKQRIQGGTWTDEYMLFDGLGRASRSAIANGQTSNPWNQEDFCYDGMGRVSFRTYGYQGAGFSAAKICSGAGDTVTFDALGRQTKLTHSDSSSSQVSYSGTTTDSVDEGNGATSLERVSQLDALGRLQYVCEVTGSTLNGADSTPSGCGLDFSKTGFLTQYAYDAAGNLKTVHQSSSLIDRAFTYDSLGRLVTAFNPESGTTTYGYNDDNEMITRTRPGPNQPSASLMTETDYIYDELHRLTDRTYRNDPTGTAPTHYVYDYGTWLGQTTGTSALGHLVYSYTGTSASSPRSAQTGYGFDAMGRLTATKLCLPGGCSGAGYIQSYTYNLLGAGLTGSDGVGNTTTWNYDVSGQVNQVQSSLGTGGTTLLSGIQYGSFGISSATLGNGHNEVDQYDERGRLISLAYSPGTSQAAAAGAGMVTISGTEQSAQANCEYIGSHLRCNTEWDSGTVSITVNGYTAQVTYNASSTASGIASSLASTFHGDYSSPVDATASGGTITMTARTTGTATDYAFSTTSTPNDPNNFSASSFTGTPASGNLTGGQNAVSPSLPVYSVSMSYEPDSNVSTSTDSVNGSWTYTYDGFNRLTQAAASPSGGGSFYGATISWTYDRFGNRLSQSGTGGPAGAPLLAQPSFSMTGNQVSAYCYDAAGNLLDAGPCSSPHQYTYDAEGRMVASGSTVYEYDAGGQRVSKDNGSGVPQTLYLRDGEGNQIVELSSSLAVQHVNIYAGSKLVATWMPSNSQWAYAYTDWQGSKRYEASGAGTYLNSWTSLPFGDSETALGAGADATEHHYTGKERDVESGLDNFEARYYGSNMGRFMSPDPSGLYYANPMNPQSLNLYSYGRNNPLINIDPTGKDCIHLNNDTGAYEGTDIGDCDNSTEEKANSGYYVDGTVNQNSIAYNPQTGNYGYQYSPYDQDPSLPPTLGNGVIGGVSPPITMVTIPTAVINWSLSGTKPSHGLWHYGNYAGPGGMGVPKNDADAGAMLHDYCYHQGGFGAMSNYGGHNDALQACNQALCDTETKVENSVLANNGDFDEANAAADMVHYFSMVPFGNSCKVHP